MTWVYKLQFHIASHSPFSIPPVLWWSYLWTLRPLITCLRQNCVRKLWVIVFGFGCMWMIFLLFHNQHLLQKKRIRFVGQDLLIFCRSINWSMLTCAAYKRLCYTSQIVVWEIMSITKDLGIMMKVDAANNESSLTYCFQGSRCTSKVQVWVPTTTT